MAKTYADIEKQIKALQARADELRKKETGDVIARIKEAITQYKLTATDLGLGAKRGPKPKATTAARTARGVQPSPPTRRGPKAGKKLAKVPVKYRDKQGNTWTGRGNQPIWLREAIKGGAKIDSFRI